MFLLRLYLEEDPVQPLAAHMLREGVTIVGRDPCADWAILDPDCEISRQHIELTCSNGVLKLRPLGSNGVFRSETGERVLDGEDTSIGLGDAVTFGKYRMVVDSTAFSTRSGASFEGTIAFAPPFGDRNAPAGWVDEGEGFAAGDETSLLEAFCEGANLDVAALSDDDPKEIMRRAGAIYREMVLGLGDLVNERSTAKLSLSLDRTTIGSEGNNPFKWAPTRKLASDLLLGQGEGFLAGPDAIRTSFADVKRHMLGTLAGFSAALRAAVRLVSPATIELVTKRGGLLQSRSATLWEEYQVVHRDLERQIMNHERGPVSEAFLAGYANVEADTVARSRLQG